MAKKGITSVEQLAAMTQREFLRIGEHFKGLEEKVDGLDHKVDGMEKMVDDGFKAVVGLLRLVRDDVKSAAVEKRVDDLGRRVNRLEEKVGLAK